MGERVGHHIALASALQAIISDRGCGLHGSFDVTRLDEAPLLLRVVSPYAGKAIGLQLDAHLKAVGADLIQGLLRLLDLWEDSKQILHVMANLVRDDIGLGELATSASDFAAAEAPLDILKERRVEIDLLIDRAIERPHGGLGEAARRLRRAGEHDEIWRPVGLAGTLEDLHPFGLRTSQHGRDKLAGLVAWGLCLRVPGSRLRLLGRRPQARKNLGAAYEVKRIDAKRPPKKAQKDDGADPNPARTSHGKALRPIPSPIFYPVAARELIKTHIRPPLAGDFTCQEFRCIKPSRFAVQSQPAVSAVACRRSAQRRFGFCLDGS